MTTRQELRDRFVESPGGPWKTFVLEVHENGEPGTLLSEIFPGADVTSARDVFLYDVATVRDDTDVSFIVDRLSHRFWSFHTQDSAEPARRVLKEAVEGRRDLDWMWLPSQHLRDLWPGTFPTWLKSAFRGRRLLPENERIQELEVQLRGGAAEDLVDLIGRFGYRGSISFDRVALNIEDPRLGDLQEGVNRQGRFVARGNSFEFHQQLIRGVVARYRRFVELAEQRILRWTPLEEGGARMQGSAIGIRFSRQIPDLELFLDELFSSREPFRLWGVPRMTSADTAEVEAVDLHVGEQIRLDVGPDWVRVYLFKGGCGNSLARLVVNLQHHFDGDLSLADPELNEALRLAPEGQDGRPRPEP